MSRLKELFGSNYEPNIADIRLKPTTAFMLVVNQ